MKPSSRKKWMIISALALLWLALFIAWLLMPPFRWPSRLAATNRAQMDLMFIASGAQQFHHFKNRWPTNLAELRTTMNGVAFYGGPLADQWRRPYLYTAPTPTSLGTIQTFGADGDPNGDKTDGDAIRQFAAAPIPKVDIQYSTQRNKAEFAGASLILEKPSEKVPAPPP